MRVEANGGSGSGSHEFRLDTHKGDRSLNCGAMDSGVMSRCCKEGD